MRFIVGTEAATSLDGANRLLDGLQRSGLPSRLFETGLLSTNLWAERYEVRDLIARGTQGAVFDVVDHRTNARLVGKVFDLGAARDWDEAKLFRREAETLQKLSHPLIPKFAGVLVDEEVGVSVLLMERFAGETLEAVRMRAPVAPSHIGWIMADVLNALGALHAVGLVHRDVKPANLILASDVTVRLVDFGGVGLRHGGSTLGVGTLGYIAPEQLHGKYSPSSDLYALAMTLVALVSGADAEALPRKGLHVDVDKAAPGLQRPVRKLLRTMLSPDPKDRLQTVVDVAKALGDFALVRRPVPTSAPPEPQAQLARMRVLPRQTPSPHSPPPSASPPVSPPAPPPRLPPQHGPSVAAGPSPPPAAPASPPAPPPEGDPRDRSLTYVGPSPLGELTPRLEYVGTDGVRQLRLLGTQSTTIGRAPTNDVVIVDDSISSTHASLTRTDSGVLLLDEGSTNGLLVNGVRETRVILSNGDILSIGTVLLRFRFVPRHAPPLSPPLPPAVIQTAATPTPAGAPSFEAAKSDGPRRARRAQ